MENFIRIMLQQVVIGRYYSDEQLNQVINVKPKNRIIIGYCRVSSHKQKDDLERQIEIIDNTEESEQQELVEDLVQIITVFSCKLQGKRANKAKKLIRELMQEETDGKSHKSNVDPK